MVIFRSNFSVFLSLNTQLTHLNASNLLNVDPSNRFLPIASQSWCSGVSKMATYIYISCRFICSKIRPLRPDEIYNQRLSDPCSLFSDAYTTNKIFGDVIIA